MSQYRMTSSRSNMFMQNTELVQSGGGKQNGKYDTLYNYH